MNWFWQWGGEELTALPPALTFIDILYPIVYCGQIIELVIAYSSVRN